MAELEIVGFESTGKTLEAPQGLLDKYIAKKKAHFADEITTDSTVDGRFLNKDGSKLDLITVTSPVDLDAIAAAQGPGAIILMPGGWDASTNLFPTSTLVGETWICSTSGLVGGVQFDLNDRVTALIDGASATIYTGNWIQTRYADSVESVAGKKGPVVLVEADITDLGTYLDASSIDALAKLNALVLDATLGDAADFATAAQGVLAATALQPENIDTLAELNGIITDATLIDTNDPRLGLQAHTLEDHTDFIIDPLHPVETGSVPVWVEAVDSGSDAYTPVNAFIAAGYGGIGIDVSVAMAALGSGWELVTGFDTSLVVPRNVVHNLPNNSLAFSREGVWLVYVKVTLTFTDITSGRNVSLRLWNYTKSMVASSAFLFFVGRDQGGVNLSFQLNMEIAYDEIDDEIQLQVGGGDSFTTVNNVGSVFQANHISEFRSNATP